MIWLLLLFWIHSADAAQPEIPVCLNAAAPKPSAGYTCPLRHIPSQVETPTGPELRCCPPDDILTQLYCAQPNPLPVADGGGCIDDTYAFARTGEGEVVCCLLSLTVTARPPDGETTPAAATDPPAPDTTAAAPVLTTRTPRPPTTARPRVCFDLINPKTSVSDCPSRAMLCNDATYYDVMTKNCPKTCGRCPTRPGTGPGTGPGTVPGTGTGSGRCVDLVNRRTGVSDCPSLRYLCNDATYYTVMTTNCPKTCGRCPAVPGTPATVRPGVPPTGVTSGGTAGGVCLDQANPLTGQPDCVFRRHLCRDYVYATLMRTQCPATCGFC